MHIKMVFFITIFTILFCLNAFSSNEEDEVIFLTLQITGDQISLVESTTANGSLKKPRAETTSFEINFEVVSKSESILQVNGVDDPRFQTMEYEDPENPGQLKHIEVVKETANFVIRVQKSDDLSHINFFRYDESIKSDGTIERSKVDLGRIDLSSKWGDQ